MGDAIKSKTFNTMVEKLTKDGRQNNVASEIAVDLNIVTEWVEGQLIWSVSDAKPIELARPIE